MKIENLPIKIKVITGLRIGGERETFEVGGLDNPVIKIVRTEDNRKVPIVPGSSLKGRIRGLLETTYGIYKKSKDKNDPGIIRKKDLEQPSPEIKEILETEIKVGEGKVTVSGRDIVAAFEYSKILVADLLPTKDTLKKWEDLWKREITYDFGTETKIENVIDRISGTAIHPRRMERVVSGSEFEGFITIIYENEEERKKLIAILEEGFRLLSQTYLGGCGSRGYGRVSITFNKRAFQSPLESQIK